MAEHAAALLDAAEAHDFEPVHVVRSARIRLDGPPERVFPLFTPVGERAWVPGWSPRFLWPADGEARRGTVFLTRAAGEQATIWTVTAYEPHRRVTYARITPGSRAGIVEVRCGRTPHGRTVARVTYTFTALSPRGNDYLRAFTEEEFRRYVGGWEAAINTHLAGGAPPMED
ncbi:MAG TPA: SRPBCC family protein [Longimicrobium sp.]|jgi:hypothetical protein